MAAEDIKHSGDYDPSPDGEDFVIIQKAAGGAGSTKHTKIEDLPFSVTSGSVDPSTEIMLINGTDFTTGANMNLPFAKATWKDSADLLDLTDPEFPTIIAAGIYAFNLSAQGDGATVPTDSVAWIGFDVDGANWDHFDDHVFPLEPAFSSVAASVHVTGYCPAGATIQLNIRSITGDAPFKVQGTIQRIPVGPGPAGPSGTDGAPGTNGTNGVDGADGQDAAPLSTYQAAPSTLSSSTLVATSWNNVVGAVTIPGFVVPSSGRFKCSVWGYLKGGGSDGIVYFLLCDYSTGAQKFGPTSALPVLAGKALAFNTVFLAEGLTPGATLPLLTIQVWPTVAGITWRAFDPGGTRNPDVGPNLGSEGGPLVIQIEAA